MVNSAIIPIILGVLFVGGAIAFCCKHFKKVKPSTGGGSITTDGSRNNTNHLHVVNDKLEDVFDGEKNTALGDETIKELKPFDEIILVDGKMDDKVILKDDLKIKKID